MTEPASLPLPTARARVRAWIAPGGWSRQGAESMVAMALLVGALTAVGAILFRELIIGLTLLFTGHEDYSALGRVGNPHLPGLGMWFVLFTPVVGGLIYGPLVAKFAPEARGHGVPEVMYAVAENGGRIRPQVPVVKAAASALTIASGGSVGREGPIVQIGSAIGSVVGQAAKLDHRRLRLLVACGAAGGISATFNAPIAGVFFALEVILRDFESDSFGVVVLSSVTSAALAQAVVGSETFLVLPEFALNSPLELVLYAGMGLVAGAVGVAFIRILYGAEDFADRIWKGPAWARPAAGGLLLGLLLLAVPQMYGVGYPVIGLAVGGKYAVGFVLLLLVAKIAATSLTLSIGGSGGVFAPSLFMGAMLGEAFGLLAHDVLPELTAPAGAYALVGMGAVFAGSARAPITAVIIVFELTGQYSIILPLMLAVVLATAMSKRLSADSIYTLKLRRRGIDIEKPKVTSVMKTVALREAVGALPRPIDGQASFDEVVERLSTTAQSTLPVLSADGRLLGVVSPADLERRMESGDTADLVAAALAQAVPLLRLGDPLEEAVRALGSTDASGLPVCEDEGGGLAGWITHRGLLRTYHRERERLAPSGT